MPGLLGGSPNQANRQGEYGCGKNNRSDIDQRDGPARLSSCRRQHRKEKAGGEKIAESGTPIRTNQTSGAGRKAESARIWQTNERMTMTPAWACPARKKFCRRGLSMYPLALSISEVKRKYPPY